MTELEANNDECCWLELTWCGLDRKNSGFVRVVSEDARTFSLESTDKVPAGPFSSFSHALRQAPFRRKYLNVSLQSSYLAQDRLLDLAKTLVSPEINGTFRVNEDYYFIFGGHFLSQPSVSDLNEILEFAIRAIDRCQPGRLEELGVEVRPSLSGFDLLEAQSQAIAAFMAFHPEAMESLITQINQEFHEPVANLGFSTSKIFESIVPVKPIQNLKPYV